MMQIPVADFDFYQRKIRRLESDLCTLQDELTAARLRLRTAEDFQIKYELLVQKTHQQNERLKAQETQLTNAHQELLDLKMVEQSDQFNQKLNQREKQLKETYEEQLKNARKELQLLKTRNEKAEEKGQQFDLLMLKNKKLSKENEILEQKIQQLKRESENIRTQEIEKVKQSLFQKNRQKQEIQRKMYHNQIDDLEVKIKALEIQLCEVLTKVNPDRQRQIQAIKLELQERTHEANIQLENIGQIINEKNARTNQILAERERIQSDLQEERKQLRNYVKVLEEKLFEKQTEYQTQLINLKQRMKKVRQEQIQGLISQLKKNQQIFLQQRENWNKILEEKDIQIERVKQKIEQDAQRYQDEQESKNRKIQKLKERLRQYQSERNLGEKQNLLKSLKDLQNKEADFANYQNGVTFLDRQLKKVTLKLQQKDLQISKLIKQRNTQQAQAEKEFDDLKEKIKTEKAYFTNKISELECEIRDLNNEVRLKDKQLKKREKDRYSEVHQLITENKGLKDVIEEMEKDYKRIIDGKAELEKQLKQQREKGLTNQSDLNLAKKQKWLELQKQKNQVQIIYKEREDQLKMKFEIERQRLRHERDNLHKQNEMQKGMIEELKKEKGDEVQQKKYSQLNKKVATLDLEIALAQNIYDCLKEAKCRYREESEREIDKVSERENEDIQDQYEVNPLEQ